MLQIAHFRQRRRHVHFGGGPNSPWLFIRCKSHTEKLGGAKNQPIARHAKVVHLTKKESIVPSLVQNVPSPGKKRR